MIFGDVVVALISFLLYTCTIQNRSKNTPILSLTKTTTPGRICIVSYGNSAKRGFEQRIITL